MAFDIEAIIAELIETIKTEIPAFKSVDEPGEALPQANPFCLVEYLGGPVDLGNLEDWTHIFRITAGVHRKAQIAKERKVIRELRVSLIRALIGNAVLNDEAFLTGEAEASGAQQLSYGEPAVSFLGCMVTVTYQTTEGVAHLVTD